jgi:hypothetical protein
MSIKRGDLILSQGTNVKVFTQPDATSPVFATITSGGLLIGTAIDETSFVGFRKAWVDEDFALAKTNPDYDYTKDVTPTTGGATTTGSTTIDGTTTYDTQKDGTVPVKLEDGKVIYVKVSLPDAADLVKDAASSDADASAARLKKWVTYGFIGVLVAVVATIIVLLTRKSR